MVDCWSEDNEKFLSSISEIRTPPSKFGLANGKDHQFVRKVGQNYDARNQLNQPKKANVITPGSSIKNVSSTELRNRTMHKATEEIFTTKNKRESTESLQSLPSRNKFNLKQLELTTKTISPRTSNDSNHSNKTYTSFSDKSKTENKSSKCENASSKADDSSKKLSLTNAISTRSKDTSAITRISKSVPEIITIDDDDGDDDAEDDKVSLQRSMDTVIRQIQHSLPPRVPSDVPFGHFDPGVEGERIYFGNKKFHYVSKPCELHLRPQGEWIWFDVPPNIEECKKAPIKSFQSVKMKAHLRLHDIARVIYNDGGTRNSLNNDDTDSLSFIAVEVKPSAALYSNINVSLNFADTPLDSAVAKEFDMNLSDPLSSKQILMITDSYNVKAFVSQASKIAILKEKMIDCESDSIQWRQSCLQAFLDDTMKSTVSRRHRTRQAAKARAGPHEESKTEFVFPLTENAVDVVSITSADLARLTSEDFLNDNLIDFCIKKTILDVLEKEKRDKGEMGSTLTGNKCKEENAPPVLEKEKEMKGMGGASIDDGNACGSVSVPISRPHNDASVYAFSCLFYSKLTEKSDMVERHKQVSRWTKNVDIFSKNFIFVPVNAHAHWSLTCIVRPGEILNSDRLNHNSSQHSSQQSCILFLDSLSIHPGFKIAKNLRSYLQNEWRAKRANMGDAIFDTKTMPFINLSNTIPKQTNSYDCGIYVTKYVQMICDLYPSSTKQEIDTKFKNIFLPSNFDENDVVLERQKILTDCKQKSVQWKQIIKERKERANVEDIPSVSTVSTLYAQDTIECNYNENDEKKLIDDVSAPDANTEDSDGRSEVATLDAGGKESSDRMGEEGEDMEYSNATANPGNPGGGDDENWAMLDERSSKRRRGTSNSIFHVFQDVNN